MKRILKDSAKCIFVFCFFVGQLLDLYENFVDSAGVQKSGSLEALGDVGTCDKLFFDTVHPNNAGYKVWWDNLKPILDVILQ